MLWPSRAMSSSSTRTAESCRQKRSPSGKRVKQRGHTFTASPRSLCSLASLAKPRLQEQREEAVVDRALALRRHDIEQRELEPDIELLVRRELDSARDRDLEAARLGVEVG